MNVNSPFAGVLLALAGCGAAQASPFETLDPNPAERFEVAGIVDHQRLDGVRSGAVVVSLVSGLGSDLEGSITLAHGWEEGPHARRQGLADPSLAVKWRFLDNGPWAAAIEPSLSAPLGIDALSEDVWRLSFPIGITRRFDRLALTGMAGYDVGFGQADDGAFAGLLATYQLTDSFVFGAEFAADAPANDFDEREVRGNLGFTWDASDRLQVYGLVGRVLDGPAGEGGTLARIAVQAAF